MNEIKKNNEGFIGYEYKEVAIDRDMEDVYTDGYSNFGWVLDGNSASALNFSTVNLKLKRDRKIRNKAELTRLQRQFESNVQQLEKLEQSKNSTASIASLAIGIIGTAFMAGAVFAVLADMVLLCVIFAIPAFIGWA